MNIFIKAFCLIGCLFISLVPSWGQEVWPGDVNNNGIVNGMDMLFLGLAFEATGPMRANATTDWQGQSITEPWTQSFGNGLNFAYADCDGDGEVAQRDIIDGVKDNFGLTHGTITPDVFSSGEAGSDPALKLLTTNDIVLPGTIIDFQLNLGSEERPIGGFYGLAFTVKYDPSIINGEDVEFEAIPDSWIDSDDGRVKTLTRVDENNGLLHIAITRTRQTSIDGFGEVGHFSIVIEDIIVGLQEDDVVTTVEIDSVWMINEKMTLQPVVKDTFGLTITEMIDTTINTINDLPTTTIEVYPNPTADYVQIRAEGTTIEQLELLDWTGRQKAIFYKKESKRHLISLDNIANGIYLIVVTTPIGKQIKRLVVQRE